MTESAVAHAHRLGARSGVIDTLGSCTRERTQFGTRREQEQRSNAAEGEQREESDRAHYAGNRHRKRFEFHCHSTLATMPHLKIRRRMRALRHLSVVKYYVKSDPWQVLKFESSRCADAACLPLFDNNCRELT